MSDSNTREPNASGIGGKLYADEKYTVRSPWQIRRLLQALIAERAMIAAHPCGHDMSFPTAILELDEHDDVLTLDGSPVPSINLSIEQAEFLLCFAKVDRVPVRFRLEQLQLDPNSRHTAYRVAFPDEIYYLQRRELYRLEPPVSASPYCILPGDDVDQQPSEWRVMDISGGGIALMLPQDQTQLGLQKRYKNCQLKLPGSASLSMTLVVCNIRDQVAANGSEMKRIGLRFEDLSRAAEDTIQRYIFHLDRQRKARQNGNF